MLPKQIVRCRFSAYTMGNPKPSTLTVLLEQNFRCRFEAYMMSNPKPSTLNPHLYTLPPKPYTMHQFDAIIIATIIIMMDPPLVNSG